MTVDLEEIKININAVLTSGGGRLTETQFLRDYRSLIGQLPYTQLGHKDVRSLISSLGGFYYTRSPTGENVINAGFDPKTAHISSLIARQRKKPGSGGRKTSRPRLPPRHMIRRASYSVPSYTRPVPRSTVQVQSAQPQYENPPIVPQRKALSFQNPPIVPQRKPLSSQNPPIVPQRKPQAPADPQPSQNTHEEKASPLKTVRTAAQDRLSQRTLDVGAAQSRIASWLSSRVQSSRSSPIRKASEHPAVSVEALTSHSATPKPALVNGAFSGITNGPLSSHAPVGGVTYSRMCSPNPVNEIVGGSYSTAASMNVITNVFSMNSALDMLRSLIESIPSVQMPVPLMSVVVEPPQSQTSRGRLAQQQVQFKSYVEEISYLAKSLGLGEPIYKYVERKPTRQKPVFIAKLKIGDNLLFSSFPDEKGTCEEAQEFVAKLACDELRCRPRATDDVDDVIVSERVFKIVERKPNGMVESGIVKEYENIYNSSLPISWLEVIADSPRFTVEQTLNGRNAIVYPNLNIQDQVSQEIPVTMPVATVETQSTSSPEPILSNGNVLHNFLPKKMCKDMNANTVPCSLPKLVLPVPKDGTWDVFVCSSSDSGVWVRFIGDEYDAKYNDLITDLEIKMFSSSEPVTDPVVDHYYCCKFDNNWLRVQLKEIVKIDGSEDEGVVFLIDNGELDTIPLSELRIIGEEYLRLPGQAVQCSLAYVDVTYEEAQTYIINHVIGSSFVAEVLKFSEDLPKIVLHNTENPEPINVNICILDSIVKKLPQPKLLAGLNFVRLSHVEKETKPFVQIKGKELLFLERILDDISLLDLVAIHGVNAHPRLHMDSKHVFLVRSRRCPNSWRRGVIENTSDKRNPVVKFVDYGYVERVLLSDIFDSLKVLPPISKYPIQAVEVSLADLPESYMQPGVVKRLTELAPPDEFVIGKVDQNTGGLRLSKRIAPENLITSINDSILFSYDELKNVPDSTSVEVKSAVLGCQGLQDVSSHPLPIYQVPTGIEFFNVHVSMSSNPSNFMVQPIDELKSFNTMMQEMQEYYESTHHTMDTPAIQELQENRAFAAKHPCDLQWYRVSIVAALSQTVISVRYSDYGDVGLVALDRIRYLEPTFKKIPALAIRAKLHGVNPLNVDWSVEECTYFNSLVQDNAYPSKIEKVNHDTINNSWRISLTLFDTSNEDMDINIAEHLVEKGYAGRA
ncbi:Tudor domain-containing protein 7 [Frankliniella fusca]|uniref:Tudor domain-containing protein 7 n=1 Tax=Frankliniella fusca TaxID=407009 RepID=A0AAE1LVX8_9NEOP|nr:Tudor domain-containing protein 7 [Frankliniella fusca]